jgi:hypothetical protein
LNFPLSEKFEESIRLNSAHPAFANHRHPEMLFNRIPQRANIIELTSLLSET